MGRDENVTVYEDTRAWCQSEPKLKNAINASVSGQKIIYEKDDVSVDPNHRYDSKANIIVSKKRSSAIILFPDDWLAGNSDSAACADETNAVFTFHRFGKRATGNCM